MDGMSRAEVTQAACQALSALAQERGRNAELTRRLQQLHEQALQGNELRERHAQLQV